MALRRLGSLLGPGVERAIGQQSCSSGRLFQTLTGICNDAASFGAFKSAADESQLPWRKQARQRISVPLTLPLPGVMPELPYRATPEPPPTEITVLDNGVRIVSESSPGPTASIGIYVSSGSIFEDEHTAGSTALLECLAFKSSRHRDTLQIMHEVEKVGSNVIANASREQMAYTIDCLKTSMPAALELLCDSVLNPAFHEAEVEEQKQRMMMLLENREIHTTLMSELMVQRAYEGGYGNPLIPNTDQILAINPSTLMRFFKQQYIGPHMVLAAAGVDHQALVHLARPMLAVLPTGQAAAPEPQSRYRGGFAALPLLPQDQVPAGAQGYLPPPAANLMMAFEMPGGWRNVKAAVEMTVLQYLLGGGASFSSGGPGKGMHSRLYKRVLNQHYWVQSCMSFNNTFNSSGLVGIQCVCDPDKAHDMLNIMVRELEMASRGINQVELERAKRAAVAVICNALESKATSAEDIGRQFLTYGQRISGRAYVGMIEAVTADDLTSFVSSLLRGKPVMVTYGQGVEGLEKSPLVKRYGL